MDLRGYLGLLRRSLPVIIAAPIVFALVAYGASRAQDPKYTAVATILLRPNDPNERLGTSTNAGSENFVNTERYVQTQGAVVEGPEVTDEAVRRIGDITDVELQRALVVSPAPDSNVLRLRVTTTSRERSQFIANTVAEVFIENRREAAVRGIDRAIDDINEKLDSLTEDIKAAEAKADGPERDLAIASLQEQYRTLDSRQVELAIDANLKNGEAELLGRAKLPQSAISPRPLRTGAIAGALAFLLACVAVLLRSRLDVRLHDREEAETVSGLSTLAEVPIDRRLAKGGTELVALSDPTGSMTEGLRAARVSLRFLGAEKPLHVLLITSPEPGDGKSTTSANLAVLYAQAGMRTLLVSADLRRPGVERLIQPTSSEGGLVTLLTDLANRIDNAVPRRRRSTAGETQTSTPNGLTDIRMWCQQDVKNLWTLDAGQHTANPIDILGSSVMGRFITEAREQFDLVILDTPPVVPVADAVVLSQFADGVIVVVSMRRTSREALVRTTDRLDAVQAPILGMIVNRSVSDNRSYGGYYGSTSAPKATGIRGVVDRLTPARARRAGSRS